MLVEVGGQDRKMTKQQRNNGPLAGLKALIIEDDAMIAALLHDTLIEAGAAQVLLHDAVAAGIAELSEADLDILILDTQVGDRNDGWAVAELVEHLSVKRCAIIFATGLPEAVPPHVAALGTVVGKPYTAEQIIAAITAQLK